MLRKLNIERCDTYSVRKSHVKENLMMSSIIFVLQGMEYGVGTYWCVVVVTLILL